jgi:hypothetical protein
MKTVQDIQKLIDTNQYPEAEKALLTLEREGHDSAIIYYMLGGLYNNYQNPNRSKKKTKEYFTAAIQCAEPIVEAFLELASIEQNCQHRLRILKCTQAA